MHDLQTIIRLNNQPVNQRTPPAVIREQAIRATAHFDVPELDRVEYGAKDSFARS